MSAKLPHDMLTGALKLRAQEYAGSLYPGAVIDASDRVYLAESEWGRHLAEALAERGLAISGDVVTKRDETTT